MSWASSSALPTAMVKHGSETEKPEATGDVLTSEKSEDYACCTHHLFFRPLDCGLLTV